MCAYMHTYIILYGIQTTDNTPRDSYGKSMKILTENVLSLTNGFKELSKTVVSALESVASGQSQTGSSDPALELLKHLPALDPADFEGLLYWYRAPWASIRGGKAFVSTDNPILTLFLEDKTGRLVPNSEMKAVRDHALVYFKQLWVAGRAPKSWTAAPPNLQIGFVRHMEEAFEFLRYCHRHWKAEQIFMNYYPHWHANQVNALNPQIKKGPKRARADNEDNEGAGDDDNVGSKRPRIEETESTPPPQPVPTTVTTARKRVRHLQYSLLRLLTACRIIHCNKHPIIRVHISS